ncbi:MAG: DUF3795 domain-containing protein [Candidatus Saliniplasma sp.]
METPGLAACGLECKECSIYLADSDKELAHEVMNWFIERGWLDGEIDVEEFMSDGPYCLGCHGKRETHWSPDCWILHCCVDEKGLDNCSECDEFPCGRLERWAETDESYLEGLERLKGLKK